MNSNASSTTVSLEVLPTTNTLIPAGIGLAILAPLTIIIDLPPLVWHIRHCNTGAASLVAWIVLHNLLSLINLIIWPTDNFEDRYNGEGLCDVEVKFMVARAAALPAASLCIVRGLAKVMNTSRSISIPSKMQRRRAVVMDLVWCLGIPFIMMFLHYIVQPNRYFLAGVSGCTPSFWASWLSIILITLPPLFLSLATAFYATLVLWRLHRYRSAFQGILASSNTTKSRFLRLFMIALVLTVGLLPVEIYVLITNLPRQNSNGGFGWAEVHNDETWRIIVLYPSAVFYDRWVNVGCGFLVFLFFGLGRDAKNMYAGWLLALGAGKVFPRLRRSRSPNQSAEGHSLQASASSKARLFVKKGKLTPSTSKTSSIATNGNVVPDSHSLRAAQPPTTKPEAPTKQTSDPFAFLNDQGSAPQSKNQSFISKLNTILRQHPSRNATPDEEAAKLSSTIPREHAYPMADITGAETQSPRADTGSMRAWSEHGASQERLTRPDRHTHAPDQAVLVTKDVKRESLRI